MFPGVDRAPKPLRDGEPPAPARDRDADLRSSRDVDERRIARDVSDSGRAEPRSSGSERAPRRDYKRDSERRADRREERRHERERLYAEFRAERSRGDAGRATWDEQRASERARYAEITARKVEHRRGLREMGLAPQIATSLAAFLAAQERVDLRDAIANERAALKRDLHVERRQAWREFVVDRAHAGDDAAISALRGLRYREQRVEREPETETPDFALRGAGDYEPRFMRDLRDVDARVERNGDVSYRWRDGGEAFRDRGPEIAFRDKSDASIAAGLELARAKWGNAVTVHGSSNFKERTLRLAVEYGIHINNSELQERQRELVILHERALSAKPFIFERSHDRGGNRGPEISR